MKFANGIKKAGKFKNNVFVDMLIDPFTFEQLTKNVEDLPKHFK